MLAPSRVIDLTQPLGPATPLWPGSAPLAASVEASWAADGCYDRSLRLPEHAGTHLDAPAHFAEHGATVDALPADVLVRPAALLDVRDRCGGDPAYVLGADDVRALEERDGPIAPGDAVLVCTGWDAHVGDGARYLGPAPDDLRFPGIGLDAARLLVGERGAAGIGIDTLGIDAGHATDFPVHRYTLPAGIWHLEGLVGLERLPARGALLVVGAPRIVGASGITARVLALLP